MVRAASGEWSRACGTGRTSLSGLSTVFLELRSRGLLGGQVAWAWGGSLTRSNRTVQPVSQGHAQGRCTVIRRAEVARRAGTVTSLWRMVAVVTRARSGAAFGPATAVSRAVAQEHLRTASAAFASSDFESSRYREARGPESRVRNRRKGSQEKGCC